MNRWTSVTAFTQISAGRSVSHFTTSWDQFRDLCVTRLHQVPIMSDEPNDDDSYLAMLNNPVINGPPVSTTELTLTENNLRLKRDDVQCTQAATAREALSSASKDLVLVSETDAPFGWVQAEWHIDRLPEIKDLAELGFIDDAEAPHRTESLNEFFEYMVNDEGSEYRERWCQLRDTFLDTFGADKVRVYLVGEIEIRVFVLGLVQDGQGVTQALVGLESLKVET